ncbi:hypothetical protein AWC31_14030 [Mycolicibacterium wolinskyi]|uniref:Uncharacterized protein n=2 Tax=Mycobacteriaceae TaxID=1762 RepID=A0A1X2FKC0_9MYCO|nr:hypothetical protein AWC31_14030 [Mycolicibacterium wolinskyi]
MRSGAMTKRVVMSDTPNIYALGAEQARRDAKEFARLAKLTENDNVKVWLIAAVSKALVAAKVMDDNPGLRTVPAEPELT